MFRRIGPTLLAMSCALLPILAQAEPPTYEKQIRPLLKTHCFGCHGEAGEMEGGLDLRLRRFIVKGGDSGPAITPGNIKDSLLLEKIVEQEMPPGDTKLSDKEIDLFRRWIAAGAKTERAEPEDLDPAAIITEEERNFWAFRPIRNPTIPTVQHQDRVATPIDAFLLQRLEAEQQSFASPALKETLVRRVYFDLIGLPPTPEQVRQFVDNPAPDAYEKLIDELLASPHYGERWGRHWLDVAGYADSEGFAEEDQLRDYAYKYRDYVIRAFNADKPFDEFIQEQLAGDEIVPLPHRNLQPEQIEKLIATGFLTDGSRRDRFAWRRSTLSPQSSHRRHSQDRFHVADGDVGRLRPMPRPSLRPHFSD